MLVSGNACLLRWEGGRGKAEKQKREIWIFMNEVFNRHREEKKGKERERKRKEMEGKVAQETHTDLRKEFIQSVGHLI